MRGQKIRGKEDIPLYSFNYGYSGANIFL